MKVILFLFLISFSIIGFAQSNVIPNANELIENALVISKKENKKVFVKFTASWCGWCHKMDDAMNDSATLSFFRDNYVIVYITVQETAKNKQLENIGGFELMKKYGGEQSGLPYWMVINESGKLIANSKIKADSLSLDADGDNAGCPADTNEIDYFIRVLKTTSKLNKGQLAVIRKRFEKIKSK
jgi:thiol-disulfide isomerase/thioredoxin